MKIKGYFPVPLSLTEAAWQQSATVNHPSHTGSKMLSGIDATKLLGPDVNAAIAAQANDFRVGGYEDTHYGPYNCFITGSPVSPPPDKFFKLEPIGQKNGNFKRRSREGDIVVSPFRSGQIWSKYLLGYIEEKPPVKGPSRMHTDHGCGLFEIEKTSNATLIRRGSLDISAGVHYTDSLERFIDLSINPYAVGWNDGIFDQMLREHVRSPTDDCTSKITEVTSEANRVILDALTAAAEAPETIKSIYNACHTMYRLYIDARRKEFRLYNKKKRISGLSRDEMSTVNQAKAVKDITDAIADVWLQFRYNIMPNVYLIEDLAKTLDAVGKQFFRFRGFEQHTNTFENINLPKGWSGSLEYPSDSRIFIKRSHAAGSSDWRHLVQTNIFVTAWELVPLSFVIDWFVNIGNALGALLSPNLSYEEGATFSWKTDHVFTFVHKQTNAQVVANLRFYDRAVISPSDYCRIVLKPDLSVYRQLDALALSWKILTSKSVNHY